MVVLVPLLVSAGIGILPNLEAFQKRQLPGELDFQSSTPTIPSGKAPGIRQRAQVQIQERVESIQSWKHLPSVLKPAPATGSRYAEFRDSGDPFKQALAREIERLVERQYERLTRERYPDLAVPFKSIPDERNGYLQWLKFEERWNAAPSGTRGDLEIPTPLKEYLSDDAEWDTESARAWITANAAVLAEIRDIGLLPDQSTRGITVDRWPVLEAILKKRACDALLLEARLAVADGDIPSAIRSMTAARGLSRHFSDVETPTLLGATVGILCKRSMERFFLYKLLPSIPPDELDVAAWEAAIQPKVDTPADFARFVKGEWSYSLRHYFLPLILSPEEKAPLPDSGEFIDAFSIPFAKVAKDHETATLGALPPIRSWTRTDTSHLSRESRNMFFMSTLGLDSWREGWEKSQSWVAFTMATFSVLKGEAPLPDPVSGMHFSWNPITRELDMPAGQEDPSQPPVKIPRVPGHQPQP